LLMFLYYTFVEMLGAIVGCGFFMICRKHQVGKKNGKPDMVSKFVSEFLGTFVLCLTVMLVIHAPPSPIGAVGIASSLMVMIYALGAVSGANFNPAVSLGLLVSGVLPVADFALYVAAQLLGSLFALLTSWLILREIKTTLVGTDMAAGAAGAAARGGWFAIITSEAIFTFVLVFTVLNVADRDAPNQYFGLAIGFVIVVGATSVGSISGGCFNPAVALMLDLGGLVNPAHYRMGWGFVYAIVELLAGVLAALLYKCVSAGKESADEDEDQTFKAMEQTECDEDGEELE
jgi:aquaporin Z